MINVNLLPKELRKSTHADYWKIGAVATAAVAVATMGTLQLLAGRTLSDLNTQIAQHESELAVLRPKVQQRDALRARMNQLRAVTDVGATLKANKTSWSSDLAQFVGQLPVSSGPLVALNNLTMRPLDPAAQQTALQNGLYDKKPVTREFAFTGTARSSQAMVDFIKTFENAQDFGVQFQSMQKQDETGEYNFSVTVGMMGSKPEPAPQASAAQAGQQVQASAVVTPEGNR